MAVPLRFSSTAVKQTPPWRASAGKYAKYVAAVLAILVAAYLGRDFDTLVLIIALAVVLPTAALLISRPSSILPVAMVTMWFETLGFGPVRMGRVMSAVILLVLVAKIATTRWRPPAVQPRAWVPLAVFTYWAIISVYWSDDITGGWVFGMSGLGLGITYALLGLFLLESEEELEGLMKLWIWSGFPIACVALLGFSFFGGRVIGFTGEPNTYGVFVVMTLPVTVVLFRRATERKMQVVWMMVMLVYTGTLFATGSRGGLVGLGAMAAYIFATLPGLTIVQRLKSIVAGAIAMGIGLFVAVAINPDRFSAAGFVSDAGAGRLDLWRAGLDAMYERLWHGVGMGGFRLQILRRLTEVSGGTGGFSTIRSGQEAGKSDAFALHNVYLELVLDVGVVGLLLYMLAFVAVGKNLYDLRRTAWWDWAWAFIGIHLVRLVNNMVATQLAQKFHFIIYGIAGAMFYERRLTKRADRADANIGLKGPEYGPSTGLTGAGDPRAARMDLRLRYPLRYVIAATALLFAVVGSIAAGVFGKTNYEVSAQVIVFEFDRAGQRNQVVVSDSRSQVIVNLARNDYYVDKLIERANLDLAVSDLDGNFAVIRPDFSNLVEISVIVDSLEEAERVGPMIIPTLDGVVEAARLGAIPFQDANGRPLSPDEAPDFEGPIYQVLWDDYEITETKPRVVWNVLLGLLVGGVTAVLGAALVKSKPRLSTSEDIQELLGVPFVASVPRPRGSMIRRSKEHLQSLGDLVDTACPDGAGLVCLGGHKIARLQSWTSLSLGAALAGRTGQPVTVVDLDSEHRALSRQVHMRRRKGVSDAAVSGTRLAELRRRPLRLGMPKATRKLVKASRDLVTVVPYGNTDADRVEDEALGNAIQELARESIVVVNMGTFPGPLPLRSTMIRADAVLFAVLDGWTHLDDAAGAVDAMEAGAPRRVGFLVVEN